eukprot:COSAG02_NODE_46680_length_347_cov_0.596774_1_plen_53_part_10
MADLECSSPIRSVRVQKVFGSSPESRRVAYMVGVVVTALLDGSCACDDDPDAQ